MGKIINPVYFDVAFLHATDAAVLVEYEGEEYWIPESQIHEDSEVFAGCNMQRGETGELACSQWIAEQKGWL